MTEDEATIRRMIDLNPQNAIAYYKLGLLLAQDPAHVGEAEAAYRRSVELEPSNAQYIYRLGLLLHESLQRFEEAEAAYRQAIELAPEDVFFYGGLINLLILQSRRSEALALAMKMRVMLHAGKNWYGLAALESVLGNLETAIGYLKQAADEVTFNRNWARKDPDLVSIRRDPRFDEIVGGS